MTATWGMPITTTPIWFFSASTNLSRFRSVLLCLFDLAVSVTWVTILYWLVGWPTGCANGPLISLFTEYIFCSGTMPSFTIREVSGRHMHHFGSKPWLSITLDRLLNAKRIPYFDSRQNFVGLIVQSIKIKRGNRCFECSVVWVLPKKRNLICSYNHDQVQTCQRSS